MTLQEILKVAQELSVDDQLHIAEAMTANTRRSLENSAELPVSQVRGIEEDPIVGIFDGPPNLATNAKEILAKDVTPESGFTWKTS